MVREFNDKGTLGRFLMHINNKWLKGSGIEQQDPDPVNTFVYNKGGAQKVLIDEISYTMPEASILPLVSNQHFQFERPEELIAWQFNREFYCILDHDTEVGCVGFLFYGIQHPMFIRLEAEEIEEINHLERVFINELQLRDNFQGEMLRTLLKRVIIKTTRIAKQQCDHYREFPDEKMNLVRKFSLLVEGNFKQEHEVKFYAEALHKSPKTLSNVFALLDQPAPSVLIRQRIILEAKRYLHYTDKSAKEIAYELGFESPAHFSRLLKNIPELTFRNSDHWKNKLIAMFPLKTPDIDSLSDRNRTYMEYFHKKLGQIPNLYWYMMHSEHALNNYYRFHQRESSLSIRENEAVGLVVAQFNKSVYCLNAHTMIAKLNGFSDSEIMQLREGKADFDPKLNTLARLVRVVLEKKGEDFHEELLDFFDKGYSPEQLLDVIQSIGDNFISNFTAKILDVPADFPATDQNDSPNCQAI